MLFKGQSLFRTLGIMLLRYAIVLIIACLGGMIVGVIELDRRGTTPLWIASAQGWTPAVEFLSAVGCNVNVANPNGDTALMFAAGYKGHPACVDALIRDGANLQARDRWGNDAVLTAATCGSLTSLSLLIKAHADVNTANNIGVTPLMSASRHGRSMWVVDLLSAGAKVNVTDNARNTPLILAKPFPNIVAILKQAGAKR